MEIGVMPLAHLARPKANIYKTHTKRERGGRERERGNGKLLGKVSAVVSARGQRNLGSGQSVVAT